MVWKLHRVRCPAVLMIQSAKREWKGSSVHSVLGHDVSRIAQLPLLLAVVAKWYVEKQAAPWLVADMAGAEFGGEVPHEA